MNFFFGYIWFRICKIYRKEDRIGITGSAFLALAQSLLIMEIALFLVRPSLGQVFLSRYAKEGGYVEGALLLSLIVANHIFYSKKYNSFYEHWKSESRIKSFVKGLLVIAFLLLPIIIVITNVKIGS